MDLNMHPEPIPATPKPPHKFWKALREWVQVIVIAGILAFILRTYIVEPFIVEGASMDPSFATGQFLLVDRLTYRFEAPHRYDVIVFQYPLNINTDYIKRIIGLPGETIKINNGLVTVINSAYPKGIPLPQPYVEADHQSYDTYQITLGPNQYFVMGDNRAQSSDSRAWGPVDRKFIIGRTLLRLLPFNALNYFPGKYDGQAFTK